MDELSASQKNIVFHDTAPEWPFGGSVLMDAITKSSISAENRGVAIWTGRVENGFSFGIVMLRQFC